MQWNKSRIVLAIAVPAFIAYVVQDRMALAALRNKHKDLFFPGRHALVVGGSSGIGAGLAVRLAQAGFDVTIVGRNEQRANEVLEQLRGTGKGGHYKFLKYDVELLRNTKPCVEEWRTALSQGGSADKPTAQGRGLGSSAVPLDVLVLTQGIGSLDGRQETGEGLERKLALHHYSRQAFIEATLPHLQHAATSSLPSTTPTSTWPGPAVLSVLSAGVHGVYPHYSTDPELKQHFSLKNCADAAGLYNDVCLGARAKMEGNTGIKFIHAQPGGVATNLGQDTMPAPVAFLLKHLKFLLNTPADIADGLLAPVFDAQLTGRGGLHLINHQGAAVPVTAEHDKAMPVVYEHTQKVLQQLM